MCPKHSDAKQTEMMGFGAEKGLLQDHANTWVAHALRSPKFLKALIKTLFRAKGGEGCS